MKSLRSYASAASLSVILLTSANAKADFYFSINEPSGSGAPAEDQSQFNIGTFFTVGSKDIAVTALGTYGGTGYKNNSLTETVNDTLPADATAYLYLATPDSSITTPPGDITHVQYDLSQIASVVIPEGTIATQASNVADEGFAFENLPSYVQLKAGQTYLITSDVVNGTAYTRFGGGYDLGEDLASSSATSSAFSFSQGGTPIYSGGSNAMGGNFEYYVGEVPEPSTYALLGLGVVGLVACRRFRLFA